MEKQQEISLTANSTVTKIMDGVSPSVAELEQLAPLLKQVEEALKACRDHIKTRLEDGDQIAGAKLTKGRASYKVDLQGAFQALKAHFGDDWKGQTWLDQLSVSKTGVEKVISEHGGDKKKVKEILGAAMAESTGAKPLRIG